MSKKKTDTDVITRKSYEGSVLDLCNERGWTVGDVLEIHPDHAAKPPPEGRAPKDIPAYENKDDETGFRCKITAIPEFDMTVTPPVPLNNEARDAQVSDRQ